MKIEATPGIRCAAATTNVPLLGSSWEHTVRVGPARSDFQSRLVALLR